MTFAAARALRLRRAAASPASATKSDPATDVAGVLPTLQPLLEFDELGVSALVDGVAGAPASPPGALPPPEDEDVLAPPLPPVDPAGGVCVEEAPPEPLDEPGMVVWPTGGRAGGTGGFPGTGWQSMAVVVVPPGIAVVAPTIAA